MSVLFEFEPGKRGIIFDMIPPTNTPWVEESIIASLTSQVIEDEEAQREISHLRNARREIDSIENLGVSIVSTKETDFYCETFSREVIEYIASAIMFYKSIPESEISEDFWIGDEPHEPWLKGRVEVNMVFPEHLKKPDELKWGPS